MLKNILTRLAHQASHISSRNYQVTVVGGANEIGQSLCLLLRTQPSITKLILHDVQQQTPGVIIDLSHIPTQNIVKGYTGDETLEASLKDSDIVLAVGGAVWKPGMTKRCWFALNSEFIKSFSMLISKLNPMPFIGIMTEPLNTTVPMAAEIIRSQGGQDLRKLFGITATDYLRAQSFYATLHGINPHYCHVPVIGGHSESTMVPLLSRAEPFRDMEDTTIREFTNKVRNADEEVSKAKKGYAPTLSVAYGALTFTREICDALNENPVKLYAYIENNDFGTSYFSGLVNVDKDGAKDMVRYDRLSEYECELLEGSIDQLRKDVLKGKKELELA